MDKFLETVERIWENNFVQALVYLLIAFIAAFIASLVVKKLFKLIKADVKFDSWGINEGKHGTAQKFIGKLVFLIVFLLFLPAALNALGIEGVSEPIGDFVSTFISYLPNVIAAALLIFIGIFIAAMLSDVVTVLLAKTKIDSLTARLSGKRGENDADEMQNPGVKISAIIGKIIYAAVILIAIVQALTVLDIKTISEPAIEIINTAFSVIPNIVLAALITTVGVVIANILCSLISSILLGMRFDDTVRKIAPKLPESFSVTKIISNAVRVLIILFILAQGVEILGLALLSGIMEMIIAYVPLLIKATLIALAALIGAALLESVLSKSKALNKAAVKILKCIIYVVAVFMILSQLEFATFIVNFAFIITLSALAVAFAIAFGIGGRDFAKKALDKVNLNNNENSDQEKKD